MMSSKVRHHKHSLPTFDDERSLQPSMKISGESSKAKYPRRIHGTRFEVITRADPPATLKNHQFDDSSISIAADVFNANSRQHLTFTGEEETRRFAETIRRLSYLPAKIPFLLRNYSTTIVVPAVKRKDRCSCFSTIKSVLGFISTFRSAMILVIAPILFSPFLMSEKTEYKCAFCVFLMAFYWVAEVMPLAITALLPVVLFPIMGILPSRTVAREFFNDANFLMMGGLIVATSVEKCNLHERLALWVLTIVGSKPQWIMLGFMLVTAILSMFISNTATAAMMVPIAQSVIQQLMNTESFDEDKGGHMNLLEEENEKVDQHSGPQKRKLNKLETKIAKGLVLSICFASNIGGTGTLTGTPPNMVMAGMLPMLFPDRNMGVNFISWMAFAMPLMCFSLIACWIVLCIFFIGCGSPIDDNANKVMRHKYKNLPKMSSAEKSVGIMFGVLIALWVGRDPQFLPGFADFFLRGFYTDGTSAMIVAILLFVLPERWPSFAELQSMSATNDECSGPQKPMKRLMDWQTMQKQFPWSVVFLLGGGFALASGVKESGLSSLIGSALAQYQNNPGWALQVICITATMIVTNICSNTVTASIFIPIVATMAQQAGLHPLALTLPTTLSCSFAFMLPVGTPSNSLAFASGFLQTSDMIISGLVVSIVTASIMVAYLTLFSPIIFPGIDQVSQLLSLNENLTMYSAV